MLSYTAIIRKAYNSTTKNPTLWLFGLFVVGGFNLNFLHFQNIPLKKMFLVYRPLEIALYLQSHPGTLACLCALVLVFSLSGLLLTNWSRIMLVLLGRDALENKQLNLKDSARFSRGSLWNIIKMSLLTSGLMLVVAAVLMVPPFLLGLENPFRLLLMEASVLVFFPMAFAISCINIFTAFYVVLHQMPLNKALDCGTDLFITSWSKILGLVAVLMVIYVGSFALGVVVIFLAKEILRLILLGFVMFHIFPLSAIILVVKTISTLLFWFLLSGLSVFFNQSLLVLFLELSKPLENPNYRKDAQPVQVGSV